MRAGRKDIYTNLLPTRKADKTPGAVVLSMDTLKKDLVDALSIHRENAKECNFLIDYMSGEQPILKRKIEERTVDKKIVVNMAYPISRNLSSYAYSTGIKYISKEPKHSKAVSMLNDMMQKAGKKEATQKMKYYQSVCGIAYWCVEENTLVDNGVKFSVKALDPRNTFVVKSIFNSEYTVYSVTYRKVKINSKTWFYYTVYTEDEWYIFRCSSEFSTGGLETVNSNKRRYKRNPIIEVKNNPMNIGDFEIAIPVLDAMNELTSDNLTNVEQIVTSYLCLFGVSQESVERQDVKKKRVLVFEGAPGVNQDAKFINTELDGNSMNLLRGYLNEAIKLITGMPDRDSSNASTTGIAEDIKTGQNDREAIAIEKTTYASNAEKKILAIVLEIVKPEDLKMGKTSFSIDDVNVDITRINRDNILVKTQAGMNMKQLGFDNNDTIKFMNITNDVSGVASRMKEENKENGIEKSGIDTEQAGDSDSGKNSPAR